VARRLVQLTEKDAEEPHAGKDDNTNDNQANKVGQRKRHLLPCNNKRTKTKLGGQSGGSARAGRYFSIPCSQSGKKGNMKETIVP